MSCRWRIVVLLALFCCMGTGVLAQRAYRPHSVLASGNWYKVAVASAGVVRIDAAFLSALGITGAIPSDGVRIFGGAGGMLPEGNGQPRIDDLVEVAAAVADGGDGMLTGTDHILFYAGGTDEWLPDTINRKFSHRKNLYSDKQYFFISVGGRGKRVGTSTAMLPAGVTVTSFDERYFHELDSVNFLNSGKGWFGEELSSLPGGQLSRQFVVPAQNALPSTPASLVYSVVARSVNTSSRFDVRVNGGLVQQQTVPSIGTGQYEVFGREAEGTASFTLAGSSCAVNFTYVPGSFNSQGWINWFELFYRRQLSVTGGQQLPFRDWASVGNAGATFVIGGADAGTQVWDVTDPFNPVKMVTTLMGTELRFSAVATSLREYVAFGNSYLTPQVIGKVANQDLHNASPADLIVVTHPDFRAQAQRLAAFHLQREKLTSVVVTTEQIYNEFAGGNPDPSAIRDFVKMYYDKFRGTSGASGKYLLLFGRGSFDYKNRLKGNTNFVPAYQSATSLDPLGTYTSDDFFGFLEDHEDINATSIVNTLDIGIGRAPVRTGEEAKNFVDKIEAYHAPASLGPWRNNITFVADDEDLNLHFQDAESVAATAGAVLPHLNQNKIYLDAFRQEGGSAGGTYPLANAAVNNAIFGGTLIWNYTGHGGSSRLAAEVVLDQQIVNSWNNANRLPLFITASCDFAPFDNPGVASLGENLLLRPRTGAIALMTTTRVVFAYSNRILNDNYLRLALQPDASGRYKTLGEAAQAAKNFSAVNNGDIINNRKFTLLGDPALTLGIPTHSVVPLTINDKALASGRDTLSATEFTTIKGEVRDGAGVLIPDFNGTVYLTLLDKAQTVSTLANDPTSLRADFQSQTSTLFRGKVAATDGTFTFNFRLPKDINYQFGPGKLSFYANDSVREAKGFSDGVIIGGMALEGGADSEGPAIKAFLNDERFVNGGITNETPVLIVKLSDSSGINTGNGGIDHDIVATLDGDNRKYYVLNDFYESDLNSYQKGQVRFQLPPLTPGRHTLKIKAWDVLNNSGEKELEFTVATKEELVLDHVLNYPNPFTTHTSFWFEHNKPGIDLRVTVDIFTVTGRLIKSITRTINTEGNRSSDTHWDGTDQYGQKIGRGVYIYRLSVQSADGKKASKLQRLVTIR